MAITAQLIQNSEFKIQNSKNYGTEEKSSSRFQRRS